MKDDYCRLVIKQGQFQGTYDRVVFSNASSLIPFRFWTVILLKENETTKLREGQSISFLFPYVLKIHFGELLNKDYVYIQNQVNPEV